MRAGSSSDNGGLHLLKYFCKMEVYRPSSTDVISGFQSKPLCRSKRVNVCSRQSPDALTVRRKETHRPSIRRVAKA